jgi:phosphatidylserine/phosphatidylglycerophosphate/cardiolipin synthase-like enzyme
MIVVAMLIVSSNTFAAQGFPSGAGYDVAFSPKGGSLNLVLTGIKAAKQQILVAAYTFTSKQIAYALVDAQKRGVKVYVIGDLQKNTKEYSAISYLANNGVPVALNGNYQDFHDKFMVIDGAHVETGSFNYSQSAISKNSENVIILWNVPQLAATYTNEWNVLWKESTPMKGNY